VAVKHVLVLWITLQFVMEARLLRLAFKHQDGGTIAGAQASALRRVLANQAKQVNVGGLVSNRFTPETSGTSPNETFHFEFFTYMRHCGGSRTFELLTQQLSLVHYCFNGALPLVSRIRQHNGH
jgi:hypothetical protein